MRRVALRETKKKKNVEHIPLIGRKGKKKRKVSAFLGYAVPSEFFSKTKARLVNLPLRFINWKSACIMPFHFGML